jgi:hypothetical protein
VLELSQELIDEYAWSLLVDEVQSAIAGYDEAARLPEIVEQLRKSGLSVSVSMVSNILEGGATPSDDTPVLFVQEGRRRWDLAWRALGGSLDGCLRACLSCAMRPMPLDALAHQVSLALQQGPKETREVVERLVNRSDVYYVRDGKVGLAAWLLRADSDDVDDVTWDNFFDTPEHAEAILDNLEEIRADNVEDVALRAFEYFGAGVTAKLVLLARWRLTAGQFDPKADFAALAGSSRVYMASNHWLFPAEARALFAEAIAAASEGAEDEALDDDTDVEAILEEVSVGPDEIAQAIQYVKNAPSSVPIEELTEAILEVQPDEAGFSLVAERFDSALHQQGEIAMCGRGRWIGPLNRPEGRFNEVPDPLMVTVVRVLSHQGEPVDIELEDSGLEGNLVALVRDPRREDVCGEDEVNIDPRTAPRPSFVSWAVPYHHTEAGTLKVRRIDGDFYGGVAGLVECLFHYEGGGEYPVWANFNLGLVFGLGEFYKEHCPPSGAVLIVEPTAISGEYRLRYDGEIDDEMRLSPSRIGELMALRQEAREKQMSLFAIISQILESHPNGLTFERLVAEANIARRSRRRLIASVLSLYHCFTPRPRDKDVWVYDPRKLDQGRRKAKKKAMRAE